MDTMVEAMKTANSGAEIIVLSIPVLDPARQRQFQRDPPGRGRLQRIPQKLGPGQGRRYGHRRQPGHHRRGLLHPLLRSQNHVQQPHGGRPAPQRPGRPAHGGEPGQGHGATQDGRPGRKEKPPTNWASTSGRRPPSPGRSSRPGDSRPATSPSPTTRSTSTTRERAP